MSVKSSVGTAISALFLLVLSVDARSDKLVVFGDEAYAPVIYLDKGQPAGILPAIFARLSKDTGDTYELVLVPWKRAVVQSEEGMGGIYGDEVDKTIADGVFVVDRDPNQVSRMRKLLAGRMDAALVGNGTAGLQLLIASDPEVSARHDMFVALPKPVARDPLYLAFAKTMNMKPALDRFNKALAAFKKTAEYKKMLSTKQ